MRKIVASDAAPIMMWRFQGDAHRGHEVDTQGDSFFVSFATAPGALDAAAVAQQGLASGPIRVRMGIHTGYCTVANFGSTSRWITRSSVAA